MKRVLVTGASGFVGRQTIAPLQALGFEVHAAGRTDTEATGVHGHAANLLEAGVAARLCADVAATHLLHLAWYAEPGQYWHSDENTRWAEASTLLLREFMKAGGGRVVTAGTCAEYDWTSAPPFDERTTAVRPTTRYAECKRATALVQELEAKAHGISQAWGRLFYLFGPHEHPARLVPSIALALLRGETANCTDGERRLDYLHVADAAEALVRLLDSTVTGPVNVARGESVSVRDIAEAVATNADGRDRLRFGERNRPPVPAEIVATVLRLNEEVGWRPKRTLADGLAETVAWWRTQVAATTGGASS